MQINDIETFSFQMLIASESIEKVSFQQLLASQMVFLVSTILKTVS